MSGQRLKADLLGSLVRQDLNELPRLQVILLGGSVRSPTVPLDGLRLSQSPLDLLTGSHAARDEGRMRGSAGRVGRGAPRPRGGGHKVREGPSLLDRCATGEKSKRRSARTAPTLGGFISVSAFRTVLTKGRGSHWRRGGDWPTSGRGQRPGALGRQLQQMPMCSPPKHRSSSQSSSLHSGQMRTAGRLVQAWHWLRPRCSIRSLPRCFFRGGDGGPVGVGSGSRSERPG